jgi:hypothetical protein
MPSHWERLCEILERAESMPAKHKSEYVACALKALALECHAATTAREDLRSMQTKMRRNNNGQKSRKKRRAAI